MSYSEIIEESSDNNSLIPTPKQRRDILEKHKQKNQIREQELVNKRNEEIMKVIIPLFNKSKSDPAILYFVTINHQLGQLQINDKTIFKVVKEKYESLGYTVTSGKDYISISNGSCCSIS